MTGPDERHGALEPFWNLWLEVPPDVERAAFGIVHHRDAAKGIAQDVAIAASRGDVHFEAAAPLRSWATRRARWLALNHLRRGRRLRPLEHDPAVSARYERQADGVYLEEWIDALPPAQRDVLRLDLQGYTTMEIDDTLGKNPRTVRSLRQHAIAGIQRYLEERRD